MLKMLFLSTILALSPVLAFSQAVQGGEFEDGSKLVWQCQKGASGKVKLMFVTPDGTQYTGEINCGTSV